MRRANWPFRKIVGLFPGVVHRNGFGELSSDFKSSWGKWRLIRSNLIYWGRQENMEGRSTIKFAFRSHRSPVRFHDVLDDRKSQARPTGFPRPRPIDPIESLEYSAEVLLCDPDAGILSSTTQPLFTDPGRSSTAIQALVLANWALRPAPWAACLGPRLAMPSCLQAFQRGRTCL